MLFAFAPFSSAMIYACGFPLLVVFSGLAVIFYRLQLHPLARYPGPLWGRISGFRAVYHAFVGDLHLDMLACHQKYGRNPTPN